MTNSTQIAIAVAERMQQKTGAFNPQILLIILGLIGDAVQLWQSCHVTHSPQEAARKHHIFLRERLRRFAYRRLYVAKQPVELDKDIAAAAVDQIAVMSDDDIKKIIAEVK